MKKTILTAAAFGLAGLLLAGTAVAKDPKEVRRTLLADIGGKTILLEAPDNMCFLDATIPLQGKLLQQATEQVRAEMRGVMLGVFADCYQIGGLGQPTGGPALPNMGTVVWMNPAVGETAMMNPADYLDMREASLPIQTQAMLKDTTFTYVDPAARRTAEMTAVAYDADFKVDYQKFSTTGVAMAMLIGDYPIDLYLTRTAPKSPAADKEDLYRIAETFAAQQVALNR